MNIAKQRLSGSPCVAHGLYKDIAAHKMHLPTQMEMLRDKMGHLAEELEKEEEFTGGCKVIVKDGVWQVPPRERFKNWERFNDGRILEPNPKPWEGE